MNERTGKPFNRPLEGISQNPDVIRSAKRLFLKRLQLLQTGEIYSLQSLESYFNLRLSEGLKDLLLEFTKLKKVKTGYQLLEKASIPTEKNLPPYLEGYDKEYSMVVEFFSHKDKNQSFTVHDLLSYLHIDSSNYGRINNLLTELKYRKQIEVEPPKNSRQANKYKWIGKKLT